MKGPWRKRRGPEQWIPELKRRVRRRPGDTLRQHARALGLHAKHVQIAFRQHEGLTPGAWIEGYRLELAQGLLLDGHTVEQAALAAGYADPSGLVRLFRRRCNCTPTEWLKANGG